MFAHAVAFFINRGRSGLSWVVSQQSVNNIEKLASPTALWAHHVFKDI